MSQEKPQSESSQEPKNGGLSDNMSPEKIGNWKKEMVLRAEKEIDDMAATIKSTAMVYDNGGSELAIKINPELRDLTKKLKALLETITTE